MSSIASDDLNEREEVVENNLLSADENIAENVESEYIINNNENVEISDFRNDDFEPDNKIQSNIDSSNEEELEKTAITNDNGVDSENNQNNNDGSDDNNLPKRDIIQSNIYSVNQEELEKSPIANDMGLDSENEQNNDCSDDDNLPKRDIQSNIGSGNQEEFEKSPIANDMGVDSDNEQNNDGSDDDNLPKRDIIQSNIGSGNQDELEESTIANNMGVDSENEQNNNDGSDDDNLPKRNIIVPDSEDDEEDEEERENKNDDADSDNDQLKINNDEFDGFKQGEHSEKVMNDIFGDSDEEEEFEGFNEHEIVKESVPQSKAIEDDEEKNEDNDDAESITRESIKLQPVSDILQCFEGVIEKQKQERRINRPKRRSDVEFLNDLDEKIADLMNRMRLAAVEDEELYEMGQPGLKKMKLLPEVKDLLRRNNIKEVLIESKFLNIMAAWLKALPNQVLPPLDIRKTMLNALESFPLLSNDILRESKIGKAVMYLLQHQKEIPENKKIAKELINRWSRHVFNLSSDYKGMTKEERMERDKAIGSKRQLVDRDANAAKKEQAKEDSERVATRPGEEGWIPRATVPKPSNKDYINRPKWRYKESRKRSGPNYDDEYEEDDEEDEEDMMNRLRPSLAKQMRGGNASKTTILEKTYRKIRDATKLKRTVLRAAKISIQGRGMNL